MDELHEFISLWEGVTAVNRVEDMDDEIKWKWTPDVQYTTQSAYRIQFLGRRKNQLSPRFGKRMQSENVESLRGSSSNTKFSPQTIWKRGWPHEPRCQLCSTMPETPTHLCFQCSYTKNVWTHLTTQLEIQYLQTPSSQTTNGWWKRMRRSFDKKQQPTFDGLMLYFCWNIWKERSRGIFQHNSLQVAEVASLITNDFKSYQDARTTTLTRAAASVSAY
jgi:hypothetical protein